MASPEELVGEHPHAHHVRTCEFRVHHEHPSPQGAGGEKGDDQDN